MNQRATAAEIADRLARVFTEAGVDGSLHAVPSW
jgi:hypothetical protein